MQLKIEQEASIRRLEDERNRLLKDLVVAEKRGEERDTGEYTAHLIMLFAS